MAIEEMNYENLNYAVFQLYGPEKDNVEVTEMWQKYNGKALDEIDYVDIGNYKHVYTGYIRVETGCSETIVLDKIFKTLNVDIPNDFKGHSLSISDLVSLHGKFFYCDKDGWKQVAEDICDLRLKAIDAREMLGEISHEIAEMVRNTERERRKQMYAFNRRRKELADRQYREKLRCKAIQESISAATDDEYSDVTKKVLLESIDSECYHYYGTRWTDVAEPDKLSRMINRFFSYFGLSLTSTVTGNHYDNSHDSPGNICQGTTEGTVEIRDNEKAMAVLHTIDNRLCSDVFMNGNLVISANGDSEVGWSIDINNEFVKFLVELVKNKIKEE